MIEQLIAWGTRGGPEHRGGVVDAFLVRARENPDAVALRFDDAVLTYGELRDRSTRLAAVLAEHGVAAESVVGLAVERSASLVVAMLAVLAAGGAYLPLDPVHPDARLAYMVADSAAALVLADRDVDFGVPVLRLDSVAADGPTLHRAVHIDQRACVLYTSGSTGRPKGVAITHRGVLRLGWRQDYFRVLPDDVVAQVAAVSFDAATFEVWGALLGGACLVGVPREVMLSPEAFRERIVADRITVLLLTTSVLNQCADAAPEMFAPLRALLFGGEAADGRRLGRIRAAAPDLVLLNVYGPTETATFASCYAIPAKVHGHAVPIGGPIDNTTLVVLDGTGRPAAVGVAGELLVGGAGVARCYVGRPDLTAQRFVPSPFGAGERLYRTGDLVRWREDGVLEFLGRTDDQVKIRGVRIEPDEVAGEIGTCPGVRAAAVGVHGDGEQRALVAHVVTDGPLDRAALRARLVDRLPAAMVPAWFVPVRTLPLTPHGKLDRTALPAPTPADAVHADYVAPVGPAQRLVALACAEILGLDRVSAEDDFFAIGGHSLLATKLVARLGVDLGVRAVFQARTVRALAELLDRHSAPPAIEPAGDGPHPLSFAQQRLWFLDQLTPGSTQYTVPLVFDLDGELDSGRLAASLRALVARHAALRTTLVAGDADPRQVIAPEPAVELVIGEGPDDGTFDLATGPLLRARLLRHTPTRATLLLTVHHAVFDGWSVEILVRDLAALYAGEPLPKLAVQYADYACWQRTQLDSGTRDTQLAYWTEQLRGAPASLDLPTDRPRRPVPRFAGETFAVTLPPELVARVDQVAAAHGATRFTALLAAFQLVLGRHAGVSDVCVGSPVSGRTRPEVAELIGFFVNTVVLRTRWPDDPTFAQLLARVSETVLDAQDNQEVPFEQVVDAVRPPRDLSRTPLFQVMLSMQNALQHKEFAGLTLTQREAPGDTARFDLTMTWEDTPHDGGLRGWVEYDVDLFDRATAHRLVEHYLTLLDSALAAPDLPVSRLAMTTEATATPPAPSSAPDTTLHELVASVAAARPDHPALRHLGQQVSYAELMAHAEAVAGYLRTEGVRPGDRVLVRLPRTPSWPAALLGVLSAGAAYVPVDPATPRARVEHMVRDSGAVLVLDDPAQLGALTGAVDVPPTAPAYVLYTSGTTGRPKGVAVSHANLVHTLHAIAGRYDITAEDRVLQFASAGFDVAAEELFGSLVAGATVVLPDPGPVPGVGDLVALARRERLTVLNLPASYWHEWVAALDDHPPAACPDLRLVVVGSERVDAGRLAAWRAAAPDDVRWLNAYGPTEATITATVHEPSTVDHGPSVPIGEPLPGVAAHVLDPALRPAPVGVPGELYLAGSGVALGYHGDPARTATRFLPDPWGPPGARMYATGDRARRRADGVLEFLGREDDQVKLRGFRIELGEIESALASHPDVRESAAVLREERLIGYVAGEVGETELRTHLGGRLPAYMVPSTLVVLPRLPKGERGKVDRAALPAPARPAPSTGGLPAGELEQAVAAIWRDVLGLDRVGADENFFELGGHSLLIVRVQARLAQTLGTRVPVVELFRYPTVRALARHLGTRETPAGRAVGEQARRRAATRRAAHSRVHRRRIDNQQREA